jgi:uracil-DNA glycosylase
MSLENKVKVTTNKLKEKYSKTTWDYLFNLIFSSDTWATALHQLMSDRAIGEQFFPKFNNLFRSFDLCPLDKVKIVIIAPLPAENQDGLAFSGGEHNPFTKHINTITSNPLDGTALDYLPGQEGVMLLNASLTGLEGKPKNHVPMWKPIIEQMIDQIGYKTVKTIFVFIGEQTEPLAKKVRKGHYKFFLPIWENDEDGWDPVKFFDNVNDLLKKIDKEPVNW